MTLQEQIKQRRSTRTFTGEGLRAEHRDQIKNFIAQTQAPRGVKTRIELVETSSETERLKLGTYGFISKAPAFLLLVYEEGPFDQEGAAYLFEQLILFCTSLGLGSCWLGGAFSRSDFIKQAKLKQNERLRIVSPLGYPAEKKRWIERLLLVSGEKPKPRKAFGSLFFHETFAMPLTPQLAGPYAEALEMLRLAPSAHNKQEWRVLHEKDSFHFYKDPFPSFDRIDMGIALCHFAETCKALSIEGSFHFSEDYPKHSKLNYVISFTANRK